MAEQEEDDVHKVSQSSSHIYSHAPPKAQVLGQVPPSVCSHVYEQSAPVHS